MPKPSVTDLQDDLKAKTRRIEELRREVDTLRDLVHRMEEQVEDSGRVIDQWIGAFDMEQDANGVWSYGPWVHRLLEAQDDRREIVRKYNWFVDEYNEVIAARHRNVGRPLLASDAQQEQVRKLRKRGMSLRAIAEETSLGLRTVCTIVDRGARTDRTTVKYLQRIDPNRAAVPRERSTARAIKALPRAINTTLKAGRELLKEAKGLK
jgi:hypothetical protein